MAKKSKTQRAKASAARSARKAQREQTEQQSEAQATAEAVSSEKPKKSLFKKSEDKPKASEKSEPKTEKKAEKKPEKKKRFQFFRDVRGEMKRVAWPTRQDVLRWSVVVVAALIFFGVFVAVLDNVIITPILVGISSLGA